MNLSPLTYAAYETQVGAGAGAVVIVLILLIGLVTVAFWLWMLIDVLTSSMPTNDKILWALIVFFFPLIGSLIYFFVRRGSARTS